MPILGFSDGGGKMGPVEARMFVFLSAGSLSATAYFRISPERVVEPGTQLEI
jgi:K+ transporter